MKKSTVEILDGGGLYVQSILCTVIFILKSTMLFIMIALHRKIKGQG